MYSVLSVGFSMDAVAHKGGIAHIIRIRGAYPARDLHRFCHTGYAKDEKQHDHTLNNCSMSFHYFSPQVIYNILFCFNTD